MCTRGMLGLPLAGLLFAAACSSSDDIDCAMPNDAIVRRIELEGTCGELPDVPLNESSQPPDGCVADRDRESCSVTGEMTCLNGIRRVWWLDGAANGRWTGEELVTSIDPVCMSRYALVVEAR